MSPTLKLFSTLTLPSPVEGEGGKETWHSYLPRPLRERAGVRGVVEAVSGVF